MSHSFSHSHGHDGNLKLIKSLKSNKRERDTSNEKEKFKLHFKKFMMYVWMSKNMEH